MSASGSFFGPRTTQSQGRSSSKNGRCHARSAGPFAAMCGRLRVGKKNLDVAGLGGSACRCDDRWPFALRGSGPGQNAPFTLPTFTSRRLSSAISFTPQARRVVCNVRPWPSWPGHARNPVSKCDGSDLRRAPCQQRRELGPMPGSVDLGVADDGECSLAKRSTQKECLTPGSYSPRMGKLKKR